MRLRVQTSSRPPLRTSGTRFRLEGLIQDDRVDACSKLQARENRNHIHSHAKGLFVESNVSRPSMTPPLPASPPWIKDAPHPGAHRVADCWLASHLPGRQQTQTGCVFRLIFDLSARSRKWTLGPRILTGCPHDENRECAANEQMGVGAISFSFSFPIRRFHGTSFAQRRAPGRFGRAAALLQRQGSF